MVNIKTNAQQREYSRKFLRNCWIVIGVLTLFFLAMMHQDDNRAAEWRRLAIPVIRESNAWRDAHCKVTEKTMGLAVENGKFHSSDNMTTYSCTDGLKYNVAESVEIRADKCLRDQDAFYSCQNLRELAPFLHDK